MHTVNVVISTCLSVCLSVVDAGLKPGYKYMSSGVATSRDCRENIPATCRSYSCMHVPMQATPGVTLPWVRGGDLHSSVFTHTDNEGKVNMLSGHRDFPIHLLVDGPSVTDVITHADVGKTHSFRSWAYQSSQVQK